MKILKLIIKTPITPRTIQNTTHITENTHIFKYIIKPIYTKIINNI